MCTDSFHTPSDDAQDSAGMPGGSEVRRTSGPQVAPSSVERRYYSSWRPVFAPFVHSATSLRSSVHATCTTPDQTSSAGVQEENPSGIETGRDALHVAP